MKFGIGKPSKLEMSPDSDPNNDSVWSKLTESFIFIPDELDSFKVKNHHDFGINTSLDQWESSGDISRWDLKSRQPYSNCLRLTMISKILTIQ